MSNVVHLTPSPAAEPRAASASELGALLNGYSIEITPKVAAKIDDFGAVLPAGTRVYVAHIEGTPLDDMVATVRRLADAGYDATPHVPARLVVDADDLDLRLGRYAAAGARSALAIAGGVAKPAGVFSDSMQMLETGLFDKHAFAKISVAGHPEGNKDIDPDGSTANVEAALRWKQAFADRTDAEIAIATQFLFEADPAIAWAERLAEAGVTLPIHIGVAGPAKLNTLIKYAISCGVGASLRVLKRRAADMSKLLLPFEPTDFLSRIAAHKADHPSCTIAKVHLFPLGGFAKAANWANARIADGAAEDAQLLA